MPSVENSVVINRPVEDVFAFCNDRQNELLWRPALVETKQTSEGPIGVGTTGIDIEKRMGRQSPSDWEITEFEPNKRVQFKATAGPMSMVGTITFDPVESGTRYTFAVEGGMRGPMILFAPILGFMLNREIRGDLNRLKTHLESQAG